MMKKLPLTLAIAGLAGLAGLGLTGCNGSSSSVPGVTIGITDAPVDQAEHVYVDFTGVEIMAASGELLSFDYGTNESGHPNSRQIDLLALQNGLRQTLLDQEPLATGQYQWIRLRVNAEADGVYDSYIVVNGAQYELRIPSGSQSGLKLNRPFSIEEGEVVDFTIDFDLRKSVHEPKGADGPLGPAYVLRPSLRLAETHTAGAIVGTLDSSIFSGIECSSPESGYAVYVFSGGDAMPDDIDGIEPDPLSTASVSWDGVSYSYTAAFIEPGDYTISATCLADTDTPDGNEDLHFVGSANVSLIAGYEVTHNFQLVNEPTDSLSPLLNDDQGMLLPI